MRQVQNGTPVVLGCSLVVPAGLLRQLKGESNTQDAVDAESRAKVEKIAMMAVMETEKVKGYDVEDVSAEKCGWDITSRPPKINGVQPDPLHIEVKGRAAGADTITVTHNEITYALNQADKFILAIVFVNPDDSVDGPHYIANPFRKEPDWGASSVNYSIEQLLALGRKANLTGG